MNIQPNKVNGNLATVSAGLSFTLSHCGWYHLQETGAFYYLQSTAPNEYSLYWWPEDPRAEFKRICDKFAVSLV